MREKFWGYFPLTKQDFKEIIDDSYIIMDTNILLDFYRYSKDTKDTLINILKKKKERLILHELVLKEFFRRRYKVINDHCKVIEDLNNKIGFEKIKNEINSFRHTNLDKENLINIIEEFENKLNNEFKKCEIIDFQKEDPILNEIMSLFDGEIIPDFDDEEKKNESKIAEVRFDKKIPPGYKDKDKDDKNDEFPKDEYKRYNDYFIWKQIMDFAKEKGKNIIFVTDDVKEDWFRRNGGKTRGPREELLNEFYKETNKKIYIYNTNGFFNAMDKEKLTSDMVEEIQVLGRAEYLEKAIFQFEQKEMRLNYIVNELMNKREELLNINCFEVEENDEIINKIERITDKILDTRNEIFLIQEKIYDYKERQNE